jgi:tetratricopeptide (TPR) repeat protein
MALVAVVFFLVSSSDKSEQLRATLQRANEVFGKGKHEEAKALYNQVLALDEGNATARDRLRLCTEALATETANIQRAKEESDRKRREAEEQQKKRQQAGPEVAKGKELLDEAFRDLYRPGADLEASRRKAQEAIDRFDLAIKIAPDLADPYYYRGRAHQFRLDWTKAESDWSEALKRDAAYVSALIERGRYRMRRFAETFVDNGGGNYLKDNAGAAELKNLAVADFKAAAKLAGADQLEAAEAMATLAEGNAAAAVDLAARALTKRATDEELWKLLGDAYYFSSNVDTYHHATGSQTLNLGKAVESYTKAIDLRTNFPEARAMRAYILEMSGRGQEALADIETALKIDHRNFIALAIGATILGGKGTGPDPERAIRLYGEGIEVKPDSYFCRVNRAVLLTTRGRNDEAMKDLDKAVELNPQHMFGLQLKGSLLGRIGNECRNSDPTRAMTIYREGEALLTRALEIAPDFPTTWFNRGAVRASMGKTREAIEDISTALQKGHPNPDLCREWIRKLSQ